MRLKGNVILELGIILIVAMVVAISLFVMSMLNQRMEVALGDDFNKTALYQVDASFDAIGNGFLFLIGALFCVAIISAFMVAEHPVFAFFSIILMYIMAIITAVFSNFFEKFSQGAAFGYQAGHFNIVVAIMTNLPIFFIIMGTLLIIVMFAKGGGNQ